MRMMTRAIFLMYGDMELYTTAKEMGIKPILGCEFYVHNGDLTDRDKANNPCYHLVLLAKDKEGYANIIKLVFFFRNNMIIYIQYSNMLLSF